ncbi:MAG: putative dehydrogenase [Akkermansiaceae bacterium]|jgi:predicted dehydrogenase
MKYFAKFIRTGSAPDVITVADAVESIRIVEAEAKSVVTGK